MTDEWEYVTGEKFWETWRLPVPGGWLYRVTGGEGQHANFAMCFVPFGEEHE